MDEYLWNNRVEYLIKSRKTMWNDDYLQFLIERVWGITEPVSIVDFGCGMGFMGAMLLPLLPQGSLYTGIDKGKTLLTEAEKAFSGSPYNTAFIEADLQEYIPEKKYDIAISHTVLQHIPDSIQIMKKMRDSVIPGGKVICMEVDRNLANAALYFHGVDYSRMNNLGILQKLWLNEIETEGSDHNIGVKIPAYMQEIGLKDIGVRLNDCVNFIYANGDKEQYQLEYESFVAGGWGTMNRDKDKMIEQLIKRGLTREEAEYQYNCESTLNAYVSQNKDTACIVSALSLIISYGTVPA